MRLSSEFDRMHLKVGQASGRPEGLLRAFLFISLYSVRAERVFCEEIEYNLLYRWFLDMYLMKHSFDPAVFNEEPAVFATIRKAKCAQDCLTRLPSPASPSSESSARALSLTSTLRKRRY